MALIHHYFTQNMDEKEFHKFQARLWQPPKGKAPDKRSPWSAENETALFQAAKALTSNPRSN